MIRTIVRKPHKLIFWTFGLLEKVNLILFIFLPLIQKTTNQYSFATAAAIAPSLSDGPYEEFLLNVTLIKVLTSEKYLEVRGHGFDVSNLRGIKFFATQDAHKCEPSNEVELKVLSRSDSSILLSLLNHEGFVKEETMYLCYQENFNMPLRHVGSQHKFITNTDNEFRIYGFRVEQAEKEHSMSGEGELPKKLELHLRNMIRVMNMRLCVKSLQLKCLRYAIISLTPCIKDTLPVYKHKLCVLYPRNKRFEF
uniref:CSON006767 protein n=1 Tax=Culicoides sonorensis TaxID=179676 RepID=A0A336MSY6_CULSO